VSDGDEDDLPQTNDGDSDEGDSEITDASPQERRPRRRLWPRGWRGAAVAGLLLLAILAFGGWLGIEATHAKSSLEEARGNAQKAKEALSSGHTDDAAKWSAEAMSNAQSARDATHSLPWNIASVVPWVGSPFKTGQQVSDVVLGLAADVLRPSVNVGEALTPDRLLADGRLDVQMLRKAAPQLSEISTAATRLGEQASAISEPGYLPLMRDARTALQAQTSELSDLLDHTALAAQLAPSMMGADGPRSYFMAFQTNAEARATGGLLGAYGVLRFDNGKPSVDTLGSNAQLYTASAPIDLGAEYTSRYGFMKPTADIRNSNLSPHFPYAAQIWKSMWEQESGTTVDGVIAIDPVALSYILGAVGPVTLPDGEVVTKDNVVELTESTAYVRFATDNDARKAYLQDISTAVVKKMTGSVSSPRELLDALGKAVGEGRISVWSSLPADQQLLEKTPLAHEVPDDPAPYAQVVLNNLSGNKIDYYLTRVIEYSAGACDSATRNSTVTVRLTNTVQDGQSLPEYVASQSGLQGLVRTDILPPGSDATSITLFATKDATPRGVLVNGTRVPYFKATERGRPTFEVQLFVAPQQTVEVKFELTEPTSPGAPRVPIQPLRDSVVPKVAVPECSK
jgi:hypothetical protein